jgi:hypothetical protein
MKVDTTDRYERIAALAAERDRREAELEQVEHKLRTIIYRLDKPDAPR